jgi:hypothetical protein
MKHPNKVAPTALRPNDLVLHNGISDDENNEARYNQRRKLSIMTERVGFKCASRVLRWAQLLHTSGSERLMVFKCHTLAKVT